MLQPTQVVVLYCQHCNGGDAGAGTSTATKDGVQVRKVMMPCSSKVQVPDLLKILADGADMVEVVACPDGACCRLVGSKMAEKRLQYAQRLLDEAHVSGERLGLSWNSGLSGDALLDLGHQRAAASAALRRGAAA
jgi:F420-non-reducing hydrogenase iron-sulfur subunit